MPSRLPSAAVLGTVLVITSLLSGCTLSGVDLASKACPCSDGWTCDTKMNRCIPGALLSSDGSGTPPETDVDAGPQVLQPRPAVPESCLEDSTSGSAGLRDRDGDETPDCADDCPDDGSKSAPGQCGCGVSDADTDGSGAPDCLEGNADAGASERDASVPDSGGCASTDVDCDGVLDDGDSSGVIGDHPCRDGLRVRCDDNCRLVSNPFQDDGDNDGMGDACDPEFCRSSSTLVAVGYGDQVHVSTDRGETWAKRSPGAEAMLARTPNWEDVVHAHGTWIATNSNGQTVTWARSRDGAVWSVRPMAAWLGVTGAQGVGYMDGLWFLGSEDGRIAVSHDDGLGFTSIGEPNDWNGTAIESFASHSGRLIAVGDQGQISYSDTPEDVSSWHTSRVGTGDFKQVFVVAGMWVAAGKGTCFYSEDRGENWTSCGAPAGTYYGLHYSNGLWMLGSLSSGAVVSRGRPDNWTEQVFSSSTGAWPVYGDCGSGRWFAGHRIPDTTDSGLRSSMDVGREADPARVISGQSLPLYGITGN